MVQRSHLRSMERKKNPKRTVEFLSETTQVKESSESTVSDNTLAEGQKVFGKLWTYRIQCKTLEDREDQW